MIKILFGIFIIFHGLVHLLYAGQSARLFELQPGMTWPDGSWIFAKIFGSKIMRILASLTMILAGLGFASGGVGVLLDQEWGKIMAKSAAILSTAAFLLLWDGKLKKITDKGLVGMLINIAIFVVLTRFYKM